jgi:coatomer protein complex subunit alpha (xenin)
MVFKLDRERPPYHASRKELFYYKEMYIRRFDFKTGKDTPLISTPGRRMSSETCKSLLYNTSNKSQHCILLTSDADGTSFYELYVMNKTGGDNTHQSYRGLGKAAVFVSRNRFAVLDRSRQARARVCACVAGR